MHDTIRPISAFRATVFVVSLVSSTLVLFEAESAADTTAPADGRIVVADVHSYRHCHNLPKRTYCHKADPLPQNWPPNTDTPHQGGNETNGRSDCSPGSRRCASNIRYGKG